MPRDAEGQQETSLFFWGVGTWAMRLAAAIPMRGMLLQLYEGDEYVTATKRHKRGERKANEYRYLGPLE